MLVNHHTSEALHRAPMQEDEMDNSATLGTYATVLKVVTSGGRRFKMCHTLVVLR